MAPRPPRLAEWMLAVTAPPSDRDTMLGDAAEEFAMRSRDEGPAHARRWYWRQATRSLAPNLRRRAESNRRSGAAAAHRSRSHVMTSFWQDLRFGWRLARRRPLVTVAAVLSLVVGISMSSVVFTLLNAAVLSPLPVPDPDRLGLVLNRRGPDSVNHNFSYPDFVDYRAGQRAFTDLVAYSRLDVTTRPRGGTAEVVEAEMVSGGFLSALGVRIRLGRGLTDADDMPGAPPVALVSDSLWRKHFSGTRDFAPRSLLLNDREFAIVGVVEPAFHGMTVGHDVRVWAPIAHQAILDPGGGSYVARRTTSWLTVMGRLKPGVSRETAAADLNRIDGAVKAALNRPEQRTLLVEPGSQGDSSLPEAAGAPLRLLLGAALLVLLVACANVANLLVARTADRTREIALRTALGASRARIARLLLIEALLLGAAGSLTGLVVSRWLAALAVPLFAEYGRPVTLDVGINWRIALFVAGAGIGATLLAGLAPVSNFFRARHAPALGDGGRSASSAPAGVRLRGALVVVQFALSLALVVSAALLVRTLMNLRAIPTGFDRDHVALLSVDPDAAQYPVARIREYYAQAAARLAGLPGVRAAGYGRVIPVGFGGSRTSVVIPGYQPAPDEDMELNFNVVAPTYFEALGIAVVDGRAFDDGDIEGRPRVVIVNETMARRYWPNARAVGQRFTLGPDEPPLDIIGIAHDVKYRTLREEAGPSFYVAMGQWRPRAGVMHVRTAGDPAAMLETLRQTLAAVDPAVPVTNVRTLRQQADLNVNDERIAMTIGLALGAAALLLAAVGLYGSMAYSVGQRTREIGVRIALGAHPADVHWLLLRQGVGLAAGGSAVGLGLAFVLGRLIENRLYGVTATDTISLAASLSLLTLVALLATWAPARRAAQVDPVEALRIE